MNLRQRQSNKSPNAGHHVLEVSKRLGVSDKSLYVWLTRNQQRSPSPAKDDVLALRNELSRMKAELKRTTEERDILKKATACFAKVYE